MYPPYHKLETDFFNTSEYKYYSSVSLQVIRNLGAFECCVLCLKQNGDKEERESR